MADRTKIEWTDASWTPIRGCTRVSEGCKHCYAERLAARFNGPGQWGEGLAVLVRRPDGASEARWTGAMRIDYRTLGQPLRWRKPRRIFVCSTSDLFHESVPDKWIDQVFAVMAHCPRHTFQVLTKRPERMRGYVLDLHNKGITEGRVERAAEEIAEARGWDQDVCASLVFESVSDGLPNVWLGVSAEDQATADERIPLLLDTPAAVRFLSAEPLLAPMRLDCIPDTNTLAPGDLDALTGNCWPTLTGVPYTKRKNSLDWVIAGGESGPGARPMHPAWARSLRDQCQAAGVAFFHKQNGEFASVSEVAGQGRHHTFPDGGTVRRVGKARAGRLLDGREWSQWPGSA